jgi:hypothetical protein
MDWILAGLLISPPVAQIELHYETEPSGYVAHWAFEEIRPGTLPGLAIRGPKDQVQILVLDFQPTDEDTVVFNIQITEDQDVQGQLEAVPVLSPRLTTHWGQEATLVTNQRERLKRFGRNRWLDVRVELRVTAWKQELPETNPEASEESPG